MAKLAWRNLIAERTRLFISIGGVAVVFVLILTIRGIFAGSEEHAVIYIRKQPASLWLMQDGVQNMHMSSSILPEATLEHVRQIDGVQEAVGVLYANAGIDIGDTVVFSYVFGIEPDQPFGGPWQLAKGTTDLALNEIIIDQALADRFNLDLGDSVTIMGNDLVIAGLSDETFGIATSIVFVNKTAAARAMGVSPDTNSYILIKPQPDVNVASLAKSIRTAIPDATLLTQDQFAESDQEMVRQMGADVIQMMSTITYIVGLLIIGITIYTITLERSREYGVLRAVGSKDTQLLSVVFVQSLIIAISGFVMGVVAAYGIGEFINQAIPEMLVRIEPSDWIKEVPSLLIVVGVASIIPVMRILSIDPVVVFKA